MGIQQEKQKQGATMSNSTNVDKVVKKPTRREKRAAAEAFLKNVSDQSFPNSKKVYVSGKIHDIKVGIKIRLCSTRT